MTSILVVDDSEFSRQITVDMLEASGYKVLEAGSGIDGLEKAERHKPDCMLLDLLMPEMDGREVLTTLDEKGLTIPVIVLSADIQETTRKDCIELGAIDFVKKPLKKELLLKAVKNAVGSEMRY